MLDGKPYVRSISGVTEDPETVHYWFTYERTLDSHEDPKLLEDSRWFIGIVTIEKRHAEPVLPE